MLGQIGSLAIGQFPGETAATPPDSWYAALSIPVRQKINGQLAVALIASGAVISPFALTQPETVTESRWHQPWSEPIVKAKPRLLESDQLAFVTSPLPFVSFGYFAPLTEPVRLPRRLPEGEQQFLALEALPRVSFSWTQWLSEPVRFRPRLPEADQPFLAWQPAPNPFVATGWFAWLTEPIVKAKPRLPEGEQQFLALHPAPDPFAATGWFNWLSEPIVKTKPRLPEGEQQFLAFEALPRVSFGWTQWLSEPVRFKPGLAAYDQSFFVGDTAVIPTSKLAEWFGWLSEPVRFKAGLGPPWQMAFTAPARLLPTPTRTGVLAAVETADVLLFGAVAFNAPITAAVAVTEMAATGAPTAIIETAANSAMVAVSETVSVPSSGSAVAPNLTASVAITETKS